MPKRASSPKNRRGYNLRAVNTREIKQRFLIVCEGAKTEPNYFEKFRVPSLVVNVQGLGFDPLKLVDTAIDLRQDDEYDQVWCIFDRDTWPIDNFNGALSKARQKKIQIAYANEAFELWYLLHFNYHDTGIPRHEYITRLHTLLGKPYEKNSLSIYEELESRMEDAIHNAERLMAQYDPPNPATDNPSTTVHLLVKELRRFSR